MEEKAPSQAIQGETARPADAALVERLRAGDESAEEELFRILGPRLRATAAYFLGWQDSDIEDVVQQTFMAAFEGLGRYDPARGGLYTWTNQICVYLCLKRVRRRKRLVHTLAEDLESLANASQAAPEDGRLSDLREAARALGEPCGSLVRKRVYEGESYAALAEHLKVPLGTVASRLARCLQALRNRLNPEG